MKKPTPPSTIELVRSSYQPTKAEKEEGVRLDVPGETILERMERLGRALTSPVNVRWIDKPRSRR